MAEFSSAKWLLGLCATFLPREYLKYGSTLGDLFRRLPHLHWFPWVIMVPYFSVTAILTFYGLHRSWLLYAYFRHRGNIPQMPPDPTEWPRVTIQLPIYNEQYVIERLVDTVARIDYPRELLDIQVLDDSTDETQEVARACVERYEAAGLPIRYLHRRNRIGFKAGALAAGLDTAKGELVALFDADFVPTPDFLRRTVPYFADPRVGMVQTRWTHLNRRYSLLTKVQAIILDSYFGMEHLSRSRSGVFFNFTGTAGVWRSTAIRDAGGWECDTLTEDIDLSFRAQLRGWRFLYLLDIECPAEIPVDINAFKEQQARWVKGGTQVCKKLMLKILRSKESARVKAEAFVQLTGGIGCPLMVLLSALCLPLQLLGFNHGWFQSLFIGASVASTGSVIAFFLASQRVIYPRTWMRSILYLPLVLAIVFAISFRVARGVLEALFGIKSDFVRTSKFNIDGRSRSWHAKKYRNRAGWTPFLEIAFALYLACSILYSIENRIYGTVPILLLLIWGLLYVGVMSLMQGWWQRVRRGGRQRRSLLALPDGD
jgi:cellulose synthase/poly-beta-1,6-N-acetylglucosamine synthase-like glycosyltransferase